MPNKASYIVTVSKISQELETDRTAYENTHKQNDDGDDMWEYVKKPDKLKEVTTIVFQQRVDTINIIDIVLAVNKEQYDK